MTTKLLELNQSEVFLEAEGDRYYARNKATLENKDQFYCEDLLCQTLADFKAEVKQILEIGCATGQKLQYLCQHFGVGGSGVDPSSKAVEDGNQRLAAAGIQNVVLKVSTANVLPFEKQQFDLVYFGFCLCWVGRDDLFAAIAEGDRVLKPGGFLVVGDFDPAKRHKRPYHHKEGLFSYKQQYANLFTASGHYYLMSKYSLSHGSHHFSKDSDERMSLCVLYKETQPY